MTSLKTSSLSRRSTFVIGAAALALLAGSVLVSPAMGAFASTTVVASPAKSIIEKNNNALVHVKFVLKLEGMGQDRELPEEVGGIMIEDSGLVLVSNLQTGGMAALMGAQGMSATPREIKVLVGDDLEVVEATLIARDSEADLAWVKITDPKGKKFDVIDFSKGVSPDVGDEVMFLGKKGKFFDRVPFVQFQRIEAIAKKPRHLFLAETQAYGSPVFSGEGVPVGVVIFQTPNREESEGATDASDRGGLAILPAADILSATVRAKEAAASGKPVDPPAAKPAEAAPAPAAPQAPAAAPK